MLAIRPIPAFSDNYIWMIQNERYVAFVDPGEARRVLQLIQMENLTPTAILITHHHADHVGGVSDILRHYPKLPVYGPAIERIPEMTHPLHQNDTVILKELDTRFTILELPGHTLGHIAYYGEGVVFCGDVLFACGCGRLFEGTKEQMELSLRKLCQLPEDTRIYCAHEYTLDNIGFAKWVEPENADLLQRDEDDMAKQERGIPTLPSTLALELKTNPFLRYKLPQVIQAAEKYAGHPLPTDADVVGAIRQWKDKEYD